MCVAGGTVAIFDVDRIMFSDCVQAVIFNVGKKFARELDRAETRVCDALIFVKATDFVIGELEDELGLHRPHQRGRRGRLPSPPSNPLHSPRRVPLQSG